MIYYKGEPVQIVEALKIPLVKRPKNSPPHDWHCRLTMTDPPESVAGYVPAGLELRADGGWEEIDQACHDVEKQSLFTKLLKSLSIIPS